LASVGYLQRERLLDETRLPGGDGLASILGVRPGRRRDHDRVDPGQQRVGVVGDERARILAGDSLAHLFRGVAYGRQFRVGEAGGGAHVIPSPCPGADDAELQPTQR
jgi:hypothetical protein